MSDQDNVNDDSGDPQHPPSQTVAFENGNDDRDNHMEDMFGDDEEVPGDDGVEAAHQITIQNSEAAPNHGAEVSQEVGSDLEDEPADSVLDDDMDVDEDQNPEDVRDTVDEEVELGSGATGTVDHHETAMDDMNAEPQPLHDEIDDAHEDESQVPEEYQAHPNNEHEQSSNLQAAQVEDAEDEDSSSLFVPEASPNLHRAPPNPEPRIKMPPPARLAARPATCNQSVIARIRAMQKAQLEKKVAATKRADASRYVAEPDDEAYLEAVLSPIQPSSSTPAPTVDDDVMEDRHALAEFQKQQRYYADLKRKNGFLTFRQDVEWMKIRGAEDARKNKCARDLAKSMEDGEHEPDLFPQARPSFRSEDDDGDEESDDGFNLDAPGPSSRKRRRRDMPHKESKGMSMQEAELQSMKVALEADADVPKKKKKTQATNDDSQSTRASSSKGKRKANARAPRSRITPKTSNTGGRKTAKGKRETEHALKQASSLFNSNVFMQQAGKDDREQPTFRSRNKQDALKELIASVPIGDQKQARSDMSVLLAATKDFDGRGSVKPAGGNWLVKGMKTSLKGYQVLGSAFMRRRENAAEEPRGGLMADQMGLGKTLMMLANIVNGQPPKGTQPRTTLLVASPALLTQWAQEIEQHTDCGLRVMRYGAGTRLDSNHPFDILKSVDVVLTTYSEVMKSYPKNEPPIDCQTAEQKIAWWKRTFENQRGVLHRMMFLRVVLDEAQAIKNHSGRTSIACRAIMSRHKWALSGTPILNSLTELYPYFKFLGVPHTGSFKIFKHNYCNTNDAENTERLLVRLSQFMIRRTHADQMFNAPILKLPHANQGTFECEFNPVERCIYDIVHHRFASCINMWQTKGELDKCYANALVMLLRLRQLTAHVLMLQFVMRDLLEVEDIERIKDVVKEQAADINTKQGRTIIAIRKQLEKHAIEEKRKATELAAKAAKKAARKAAGLPEDEDEDDEAVPEAEPSQDPDDDEHSGPPTAQEGAGLGGSGKSFGKNYDFKPFLRSLKTGVSWEKAKKKAACSFCSKAPKDPWISSCGHLICSTPCLEKMQIEAAEAGKSHVPCKTCGITPTSMQPCDFDEQGGEGVAEGTRSKAAMKKAKQKEKNRQEDISEDWLSLAGAEVLPSAKTLAIKAQILNWTREDPKVKIIVYTQFLAMIRILNKICQHEGWQAEQYVGTMSFGARDKALSTFANNSKCNILLASLRCGGLGLNLTMASRVIMVDPWWNEASEQQAFCRVFRIGQKEETYMSRLCVKNTVDQRLVAMQERKKREIDEVMQDDGSRVKKMSIRDLMRLFGNLDEDEDGKPFIMVDNPDPTGGFRADRDDEGFADDA